MKPKGDFEWVGEFDKLLFIFILGIDGLKQTVISGLCYIKDLIILEDNIVWFLNPMELDNILSYSKFFIQQVSAPVFGKECIIWKKL